VKQYTRQISEKYSGKIANRQVNCVIEVECTFVEGANLVTYPSYCCKIQFPERPNPQVPSGKMPPVTVYWYEESAASRFKLPEGITKEDFKGHNSLLVGSKGGIMTSGRSEGLRLWPAALKEEGFKKPEKVVSALLAISRTGFRPSKAAHPRAQISRSPRPMPTGCCWPPSAGASPIRNCYGTPEHAVHQ
jgi:hypothetical protein